MTIQFSVAQQIQDDLRRKALVDPATARIQAAPAATPVPMSSTELSQLSDMSSLTRSNFSNVIQVDAPSSSHAEVSFKDDITKDGFMDKEESGLGKFYDVLIKHFDADNDGVLSADETTAAQLMKTVHDNFVNEIGEFDFFAFASFVKDHGMSVGTPLTLEQVKVLYAEIDAPTPASV